jgi:hypothetical protein
MDWGICGKKLSRHSFKCYSGMCLQGLRKTRRDVIEESWYAYRNSISVVAEYEEALVSLWLYKEDNKPRD